LTDVSPTSSAEGTLSPARLRPGRVHPQIAWAKLRALRDGGDREQKVVELNSKVPVRAERNKKQEI
jgi:hypothetical protein